MASGTLRRNLNSSLNSVAESDEKVNKSQEGESADKVADKTNPEAGQNGGDSDLEGAPLTRFAVVRQFSVFVPFTDLEDNLLALEKLDRASPDLWPDHSKFLFHT